MPLHGLIQQDLRRAQPCCCIRQQLICLTGRATAACFRLVAAFRSCRRTSCVAANSVWRLRGMHADCRLPHAQPQQRLPQQCRRGAAEACERRCRAAQQQLLQAHVVQQRQPLLWAGSSIAARLRARMSMYVSKEACLVEDVKVS